jgi:VWFA-related protein
VEVKMRRANRKQFVCSLLALFILALFSPLSITRAQEREGVRADLPENGNLRVENLRGGITLEIWNENFVSISATAEGQQSRSPAIIQRTERLLSVRVPPAARANGPGVNLTIRIPQRTHAAIITTSGTVRISEVPAALMVQTGSGPVVAELPPDTNANIIAESIRGTVSSALEPASRSDDRVPFQARLGTGNSPVRLHSDSGKITLAFSDSAAARTSAGRSVRPSPDDITETKPPRLIASGANRASSGTTPTADSSPEEVSEGDIIRVDTQLVSINVSVIDRGTNRGVAGLKREDFRLFEDGVEQQIAQFESSSAPFNLVLLIDLSGSTARVMDLIRTAALHFVEAARPFDRISVITFAGTQVVVSPLTTDHAALRDRINAIARPEGSTKLHDSLAFAMEQGFKSVNDSSRNAIVLLSDGLDSTLPNVTGEGSTLSYNDVLRAAQEFDGVLYTLWVDTQSYEPLSVKDIQQETFDLAHDRMQEFADAGGGVFYEVEKLEDLAGAYDRVVADLGTVYTLAYRPSNKLRDGKFRALRVSINRPNTVARGRRGYYAK